MLHVLKGRMDLFCALCMTTTTMRRRKTGVTLYLESSRPWKLHMMIKGSGEAGEIVVL